MKPARDRLRARGLATEQITAARAALTAAVGDLLANRTKRCAPRCPGWVLDDPRVPECVLVCLACARLSGYEDLIDDHDVAGLPAARRALAVSSGELATPTQAGDG